MTTPKEALGLKPCPFCGGHEALSCDHDAHGFSLRFVYCHGCSARSPYFNTDNEALKWWNTRATASPHGEDAVERVARIIDPTPYQKYDDAYASGDWHVQMLFISAVEVARTKARAILATGLVPDEAAIRADEREKCAARFRGKDIWTGEAIAAAIRSGGGE